MKNVLITGASSGIGKQLALDYARMGYHVYICARRREALEEVQKQHPDSITVLPLDVSIKEKVLETLSSLPKIDIAILNAGTCEYVDVENFSSDLFDRVFKVNFFGVVYCVEALLPKLQNGSSLAIVGSLARLIPFTRSQAYGSSKAAIAYFTHSLAVDLKNHDIKVHLIDPGFVETPLTDKNDFEMPFIISSEKASKTIINKIKQGTLHIAFPWKLSWILFLCRHLPETWQRKICQSMKEKS